MRVGILITPYFWASSPSSSTLTLTTLSLSPSSLLTSSTTGATMRQGPHHSAQKSTNTGWSELSTSCSNSAPVISLAILIILPKIFFNVFSCTESGYTAVADSGYHLTPFLLSHISHSEDTGDVGAHICIGNNIPFLIQSDARIHQRTTGLPPHKDKEPFDI